MTTRLAPVATFALALTLAAGTALAAAPQPDGHDRALVRRLGDEVATVQAITKKTGGGAFEKALERCSAFKKDPSQTFAAVFALLPVLLIDVVNQYKPQLDHVRESFARMHPHSALFRRWLTLEGESLGLILRFDNHGKKIDYCRAATVMLDEKSTAGEMRDVLGLDPALLPSLTKGRAASLSAELTRLGPKMRAFFVAAGLPPTKATALTS